MTRELEPLPLTGERTVPGVLEENYWFRRHEIAYLALLEHCAGARVLEAGCGEGYGARVIADVADRVVALDYDELTSRHVAKAYPEVVALRGNLASLPLASSTVDVVVNFQVIEHLWDQPGFLRECLRVLRPGGRLLISTPNRITFSPGRDTPLNPFHTRELAPSELDSLLTEAGFVTERLLGLHHGPRLRSLETAYAGSIIDAQVRVVLGDGVWPPDLLRDIGSITASDFVLSDDDLDASLDLVAVAVRP
ncbi:bifunctional 2-polyprenyl-6-hydroxyphenol methylase/3-demethylubiquinol 3-O-methyltransferase UbiG [Allokutzneria sp. NRRL B-24872]|uniref:class I SAM-dependent methyltransferase n=1 Tax=Allokutzneria sp. NRRL B-24872 TaxID=1137961 RepID=UPI000A3B2F62|nr:class I SAM-dependent methyltransferase [Allokutzneria sp. NRRL B-24872]